MSQQRIYVASSWRNPVQPEVVRALRDAGHVVYDFRHPGPDDHGFHWHQVGLHQDMFIDGHVPMADYQRALQHRLAMEGFRKDFDAMAWADVTLLVLPCGRSAHLELGWAAGAEKHTAIMAPTPYVVPELMYLMADKILTGVGEAIEWLSVLPAPEVVR